MGVFGERLLSPIKTHSRSLGGLQSTWVGTWNMGTSSSLGHDDVTSSTQMLTPASFGQSIWAPANPSREKGCSGYSQHVYPADKPIPSCVIWDTSLNLSELQLSHLQKQG